MADVPNSNRRDFLTGRAAQKVIRSHGENLADSLQEAAQAAPPAAHDTVRLETRAMACQWSVVMNPGPPRHVMVASDALDCVHMVEQQLTVYRNDSDIARVNQHAFGSRHAVTPDLFAFLLRCRELWEQTEGAFDPAMGTLIQLWRTARAADTVPTADEVAAALSTTGFQHVQLHAEDETVSFDRDGLLLDFAAIGKGYAVDLAADHVRTEGIADFLVHGGHSSLIAAGRHAVHHGWPVGIKNPLFTERRYATVLLRDQAMSTSGSNVQFFRHQGKRYGHILDPRTGWPAEGLLSVSVIAPTATLAEALSTAFYVMGLDKAVAYCHHHLDVGAILVPPPVRGRTLEPIVCNLPDEQLFFEADPATP
ncbi:FAD:protein FMN transferase [Planctomicrobium piriforme]|uniref:FAD:protein FMN transferase n=1 Tax=Planctomicrobium piriforme TaxID=1576369 RepID=A0A1I3RQR5_9PLAN|nr:FAD:protein FMN transferase [Planctomicrobium piriforme]SFJ48665.1 thiamine biosynthesis lipoprotein [Planctomicrobium piriforme]